MSIAAPTSSLSLERQVTGTNSNTWGDRTNANWTRVDQTQASLSVDVTAGDVALTVVDSGDTVADAGARYGRIVAVGSPLAPVSIVWPSAVIKPYILVNGTSQPVVFKIAGQTGVYVLPGISTYAYCNGTDIVDSITRTLIGTNPGAELAASGAIRNFGSGITNSSGVYGITYAIPFKAAIRSFQLTLVGAGFFPVFLSADFAGRLNTAIVYASNVSSGGVVGVNFTWEATGF